ncbi:hypothetical protein ACTOV4_10115 [Brucella sp. C7-11G]
MTPLSATTFLGPRTEENGVQFDAIANVFRDIRSLPPMRRPNPNPFIQSLYWDQYRKIGPVLASVPELAGWHMASDSECEKLYKIDGQHYWAFAYLESYVRTGILTVELMWPNKDGFQPCLPCSSLLDGARQLNQHIEILRKCRQSHESEAL